MSSTVLQAHDRCARSEFLARDWERVRVRPSDALLRAVEAGLEYDGEEDPGQNAGDELMTIAAERGLDTSQADQYGQAHHLCSLADLLTFFLRPGGPWQRPEDARVGKAPWISSAFLDPSGTRLRRVVIVDRWSLERKRAEEHSWKAIGEVCAYEIPMTQTVLVVGQHRDGRRHSAWSKGWLHPMNNTLRIQKRSGETFGGAWKPVWREDLGFSREKWLDAMTDDGVIGDLALEEEVKVPEKPERSKILDLMERKMTEIRKTVELPDPRPSVCDWPLPCQFLECCWNFTQPSERNGYVRISL